MDEKQESLPMPDPQDLAAPIEPEPSDEEKKEPEQRHGHAIFCYCPVCNPR